MDFNVTSPTKNTSKQLFFFAENPGKDAAIWGGLGVAGGAAASVVMQKSAFKNNDKFISNVNSLKEQLKHCKSEKQTKNVEKALECLKNKKINYKYVKNMSLFTGLLIFLPQLCLNYAFYNGKKKFDKLQSARKNGVN